MDQSGMIWLKAKVKITCLIMAWAYPINAQQFYIIKPSRTSLIDGNVPAGNSSDGKTPMCASKVITWDGDYALWSDRNRTDNAVLWALPWFPLLRGSSMHQLLRHREFFARSSSSLTLLSLQGHCLCLISVYLHHLYVARDYCAHLYALCGTIWTAPNTANFRLIRNLKLKGCHLPFVEARELFNS